MSEPLDARRAALKALSYEELLARYRSTVKVIDDPDHLALVAELNARIGEREAAAARVAGRRAVFLGWLQIVAGVVFAAYALGATWGSVAWYLCGAIAVLSAAAGVLLLKGSVVGWWSSFANQALQLIAFEAGGFVWNYTALGGIYVGFSVENGVPSPWLQAVFAPGFEFELFGVARESLAFSVDLIPAFFLGVLLTLRRNSTPDRASGSTPVRS